MTRRSYWIFLLGALIVLGGSLIADRASGSDDAERSAGMALFVDTHKCNMCHSVPAAGIEAKTKSEKMKGADLGGKLDADFKAIAAYVRKEGELDGKGEHKKPFKGSDEELQAILDWLGSLEAQE